VLSDPTTVPRAEHAFVDTYDPPTDAEPWELIQQYEELEAVISANPELGRHALAETVGIPPGRVRSWRGDSKKPDPLRGLETARDRGWIINDWEDDRGNYLNILAAWICASGSIDQAWVPRFIVSEEQDEQALLTTFAALDIDPVAVHTDDTEQTTNYKPQQDASVLGRILFTWTGIRGYKNEDETRFPRYPQMAPESICRAFAQVYVQHRGTMQNHSATNRYVQIQSTRSDGYRQNLAEILQQVVSDPTAVRATGWPVRIYESALSELRQWPAIIKTELV
jgi:hypothetical protein